MSEKDTIREMACIILQAYREIDQYDREICAFIGYETALAETRLNKTGNILFDEFCRISNIRADSEPGENMLAELIQCLDDSDTSIEEIVGRYYK